MCDRAHSSFYSAQKSKKTIQSSISAAFRVFPEVKNKHLPLFISHSESLDLVIFTVPVKLFTALSLLIAVSGRRSQRCPLFIITSTSLTKFIMLCVCQAALCSWREVLLGFRFQMLRSVFNLHPRERRVWSTRPDVSCRGCSCVEARFNGAFARCFAVKREDRNS